jgi:hypothetical protein
MYDTHSKILKIQIKTTIKIRRTSTCGAPNNRHKRSYVQKGGYSTLFLTECEEV